MTATFSGTFPNYKTSQVTWKALKDSGSSCSTCRGVVTITASASDPSKGAMNVLNGEASGLGDTALHSGNCMKAMQASVDLAASSIIDRAKQEEQVECEKKGGKWRISTSNPAGECIRDAAKEKAACEQAGGTWDTTSDPVGKCITKAQKDCESNGDSWEVQGTPTATGDPVYGCEPKSTPTPQNPSPTNPTSGDCGGAKTNLIPCSGSGEGAITGVLVFALQIMTVGVGILAVGGITYGAILYASAQDNAGQTKKAIEVITNTVIGLLLYMFMFAILNLLVPGGVLT
ncbi:MAG: hypothetical protein EOO17_04895 [Chloroflexi bacterium]|nr:MAG: hypothetical protein EOO17_04895 [Chloroflexota bacterium]